MNYAAQPSLAINWRRRLIPELAAGDGVLSAARLEKSQRLPWLIFTFLFCSIAFTSPGSLTYSLRFQGIENRRSLESVMNVVSEGDHVRQTFLLLLGLWAIASLIRRGRNRLHLGGTLGWLSTGFIILAGLSPLWSDDPAFTARRVVVLILICLGALAAARRFSWREITAFTLYGCSLTLIISLGAEIVLGTFHPFYAYYRFSGIMHPNAQGFNCTALLLAAIVYSRGAAHHRWLYHLISFIALVFLFLTKSRTAVGAGLIAAFICVVAIAPRLRRFLFSTSVGLILITAAAIGLIWLYGADLLVRGILSSRYDATVNDILSVSGRIPMWKVLFKHVAEQPLLGYGYDSFWTPLNIFYISSAQGWIIQSAHSGYLEIALSLGLIGLSVFILILVIGIVRGLRFYRLSGNIGYAFALSMLIWLAINMVNESIFTSLYLTSFITKIILSRLAFVDQVGG